MIRIEQEGKASATGERATAGVGDSRPAYGGFEQDRRQFRGNCFHCGRAGHQQKDCRRRLGTCLICGSPDHRTPDCSGAGGMRQAAQRFGGNWNNNMQENNRGGRGGYRGRGGAGQGGSNRNDSGN